MIAVILSLTVFLATFSALTLYTSGQGSVVVSVQPPNSSYPIDSFFDITLMLEDWPVDPLDGFEITVTYDHNMMEVLGVSPGPVVPGGDVPLFSYQVIPMGILYIRDMPINGIVLNKAPQPIAFIHFHCLAQGVSPIQIQPQNSMFYDIWGGQYPVVPIDGSVTQTAPPAHTYVNPALVTVSECSQFAVDIDVQSVTNLYGFSLTLNYNTSYLDAVDILPGSFLPSPIIDSKTIDDATGTITFSVHSGTQPATSGDGTLATIIFHCTGAGASPLTLASISLYDSGGMPIQTTTANGNVNQFSYWEPTDLEDIVELPYTYALQDRPFAPPGSPEGYADIRLFFENKGYTFDVDGGSKYWVQSFFDVYNEAYHMEQLSGEVTSWWSNNTLADGTKACLLSVEMVDNSSMAMGFITNVLPPEQMPGVDPYIIWNAEPYFFIEFYWWSWLPVNRIVTWSYWWHDSHNHPNWFWGPYYWWRTYTKAYYLGYWPPLTLNWAYWQPWWGWYWHWMYWQHWHWWSTYFPYDVA